METRNILKHAFQWGFLFKGKVKSSNLPSL